MIKCYLNQEYKGGLKGLKIKQYNTPYQQTKKDI